MKTLAKPDFSVGGGGFVDPDFIPASVKGECFLHLNRSKLTESQQTAFLAYANDIAEMVMDGELAAGSAQRARIVAVQDAAHALLTAINALQQQQPALEGMRAHTDYLTWGSTPPVKLPQPVLEAIAPRGKGELLATAWDWISALELAADYASNQFVLGKQSKPDEMRARGYVSMLAQYVKDTTGKPPPKDPAAWFAGVMRCLGEHLGLSIGARIVASGIEAIR
jgi:hypothetical protein